MIFKFLDLVLYYTWIWSNAKLKLGIGMKTIAERAAEFAQDYEFVEKDMDCRNCNACRKCKDYIRYVDIVTEQRENDIERAILWLRSRSEYPFSKLEDSFRTFMEEE